MKRIDAPSTSQLDFVGQSQVAVAQLSEAALESLLKKSQKSGIPADVLEEVYLRGASYWEPELNITQEQFAFQRVNSFVAGGLAREMDSDLMEEKKGLWANIHAKRERIKRGSGERMRKPGSKGAPTDADFRAANEAKDPNDPKNRLIGSDDLVNNYKSVTPGQGETIKVIKKVVSEATYQGKTVPLNKPMKGDVKKSKVYVDPDGDGKAQKVNFGDKNMTIKKNIPARRKSFRARHHCENPGPKNKARYWSCRAW